VVKTASMAAQRGRGRNRRLKNIFISDGSVRVDESAAKSESVAVIANAVAMEVTAVHRRHYTDNGQIAGLLTAALPKAAAIAHSTDVPLGFSIDVRSFHVDMG
jgi:hypothetical protein